MPRLRQITCQVEWPETGLKFEEYGTVYGDGVVETFIAVPDRPQPFSIHLTSKGYIAEGLATLVYIDGEYQCNRNRLHLKPPKKGQARDQTDVEFRLRQKEKTIGGGTFIGRDWRFDCHNIVPSGQFPGDFDPSHFDQLGVIEVIVLRCRAKSGECNGSESLTHESILGEIDNFGQGLEDPAAPDEGAAHHRATVADAPEEAEGLAVLAGNQINGAADGPDHFGSDGAADQPRHFGLDGEAPSGYWTYHPQPPPRNDYRPENGPERRVHFDWGSPRGPSHSQAQPSQQQSRPGRGGCGGGGSFCHRQSNWQHRAPADYGGPYGWHTPQPAPTYAESARGDWGMPNDVPQGYSGEAPNEYSDYDDPQPYIPPPKPAAPHQLAWMGPGYAALGHSGWTPTPSASYPVWTPQPQFGADSSFSTTPAVYPPFCPPPYGFQGPGYTMNYAVPARGWAGTHSVQPGNLSPAREENNQNNTSETKGGNDAWGNSNDNNNKTGNNNGDADNTTAGGWDQDGTGGDAANTNNANNKGRPSDGDQNKYGDQQTGNDGNTGWDDLPPDNTNSQTQGNWDGNNAQNNQTQGGWDNDANGNTQPQQLPNDWNATAHSQPAVGIGSVQTGLRSARPLYGPYGAYYGSSSRPRTTLSPTADAEEEPRFDVPETVAADKGTTHQVQPGKGYLYIHKRASPDYVDSIEEPYARFVFKYRTKEQIEREIGIKIECELTDDEEKMKFTDKTQDELIELLIRAQNALRGNIPSPPPPPPPDGEEGVKQDKAFMPAPLPAPSAYKYLKYELPKGRNPGLGISRGGNNVPHTQSQQQSAQQGGGDGQISASGHDWGAPPGQQQTQQSASNWQTAAEGGNQNQGGGNSTWQNLHATNQSSPADGGWGLTPNAGSGRAVGGAQEAQVQPSGGW